MGRSTLHLVTPKLFWHSTLRRPMVYPFLPQHSKRLETGRLRRPTRCRTVCGYELDSNRPCGIGYTLRGSRTTATAVLGSPFSITVRAEDAFNNIVPNYGGTIHFGTSDTGQLAAVPPNYTFAANDDGVHVPAA